MDAITRISYYFPTHTLTIFQILANLVINDASHCGPQERALVTAMLVLFSVACFFASFTDTYTALNGQKFWVLIMPFYGPICFSLPTDEDKDRVYDNYYLKIRDYVHAVLSATAFILIMLFTNPVCMCLFPSDLSDGTSQFDAAIVRTVPIVVALLVGMIMMCLGPPRQMLGFQNVPETCPIARQLSPNPMYAGSQGDYPPAPPDADDDYESGPSPGGGGGPSPAIKSMSQEGPVALAVSKSPNHLGRNASGVVRETYPNDHRPQAMNPMRSAQRAALPANRGDYGASDGGYVYRTET